MEGSIRDVDVEQARDVGRGKVAEGFRVSSRTL